MKNEVFDAIDRIHHFKPSDTFVAQANIQGEAAYQALCQKAEKDYEGFWSDIARKLVSWQVPFSKILDDSKTPFFKWFSDGKLNLSYNCLDRHLPAKAHKTALIFESDEGAIRNISYKELLQEVCRFANGLKSIGIKKGDRVIIYMPLIPEAIIAIQACARIGAIHSVVFGGFSANALKDRIADTRAKAIITVDEWKRGGKVIPLKTVVDAAITGDTIQRRLEKVIVFEYTHPDIKYTEDKTIGWRQLIQNQSDICIPEWLNAEETSFILYTSGSTGKPKGLQHSVGGYLTGVLHSMHSVFDIKDNDIFWCTADIGWITGHSYVAYGPLACGITQVIYEGTPVYPNPGRFWNIIDKHKVSIFYTAPTAIRLLIKHGTEYPRQYHLDSLRLLGSVGEPINPEAWHWFYKEIGHQKCPIADTWWQTETGTHVIAPIPGAMDTKPGSCSKPLPGMIVDIIDETGKSCPEGNSGYLVIKKPFPSLARNIWHNKEKFLSYFPNKKEPKWYFSGDMASRDRENFIWISGRADDVINVSGHRMGTMEVESVIASHPEVAETAVVSRPDSITGEAIVAFVVFKGQGQHQNNFKEKSEEIKRFVTQAIGKIAQPADIRFGESLPKTRSGKIMRRLLRTIARGETITQDTSTLENPSVLEQFHINTH